MTNYYYYVQTDRQTDTRTWMRFLNLHSLCSFSESRRKYPQNADSKRRVDDEDRLLLLPLPFQKSLHHP